MKKFVFALVFLNTLAHAQAPFGNVLRFDDVNSFAANTNGFVAPGATAIAPFSTFSMPMTIEFFFHPCNNQATISSYNPLFTTGVSGSFLGLGFIDTGSDPFEQAYLHIQRMPIIDMMYQTNQFNGIYSNRWHHFVVEISYDAVFQKHSFSVGIDGVRILNLIGVNNTNFHQFYGKFCIGKSPSVITSATGAKSWKGSYDEMRISRAIIYDLKSNATYTVPVAEFTPTAQTYALWHFNETIGDTIFQDATPNNYDLLGVAGAKTVAPRVAGSLYPFAADTLCPGDQLVLSGADIYNISPDYGWNNPQSSSPTATATDTTVTYVITGYSLSGCDLMYDTVTVTFRQGTSLAPAISFCPGTSLVLNAGPGFGTYAWSTGATGQSITVNAPGTYSITTTGGDCPATNSVIITEYAAITVDAGPDYELCPGQTQPVTLTFSGPLSSWLWSSGIAGLTDTLHGPGDTLTVTVGTAEGCFDTDTVVATLAPSQVFVFVTDHLNAPLEYSYIDIITYDSLADSVIVQGSIMTGNDGMVIFPVYWDRFTFRAHPDSLAYPGDATTYYHGDFIFDPDSMLTLPYCSSDTFSFNTLELASFSGPLNIPGLLIVGGRGIGDPVQDMPLILVSELNEPVQFVLTDAAGEFDFTNLAAGEYFFWADHPAIDNSLAPSLIITDNDSAILTKVTLGTFGDHLEIIDVEYLYTTGISEVTGAEPRIYPNPVDNMLYVIADGEIDAALYDQLSKQVTAVSDPDGKITMLLGNLSPGIYYLSVKTGSRQAMYKVIKR